MMVPRGFEPQLSTYYGAENLRPATVFDGRFYQPGDTDLTQERLHRVQPYIVGNQNPGLLSLDTYQDWVELDWKEPHGSWAAVKRFGKKLVDEELALEIIPELMVHSPIRHTYPNEPYATPTRDLTDELGDFLWPITALASNGWLSINEAVAAYLHVRDLLPKRNIQLKFVDIDYVLAAGFNPTKTPLDDLWPDDDFDEYDPAIELAAPATAIRAITEKQYGHNKNILMTGWLERVGEEELLPVVGRTFLVLGYIAQQWARTTLAEVAVNNMRKISPRAASNTIDKADGPRI